MHILYTHWRKFAFLLPVAALIAAVAFFFGGSLPEQDQAFATGGTDTSGVTCTNLFLAELQNPSITDLFPAPLGNPPTGSFHAAISITRSYHDTATHILNGVTQTVNFGIPGVIAGSGRALVPCASVTKVVATVSSVTGPTAIPDPDGTGPAVELTTYALGITGTGGNLPEVGMMVYWDAVDAGFYQVTATNGTSTATILKTLETQICNNIPGAGGGNGSLHACEPVQKAFPLPAFSYSNGATTTKPSLLTGSTEPRAPGGYPCAGGNGGPVEVAPCTSIYDKANGTSISIGCSPSTGPNEGGDPSGVWTRLETRTVSGGGASSDNNKVPSYGQTIFYTPVDDKTCETNANTERSTLYNVTWSMDPDTADFDGDGCLDRDELQANQPVAGGGRDVYNPYDCDHSSANGAWNVQVNAVEISTPDTGNTIVAGSFFRCRATISGTSMPIYCYRDDTTIDLNTESHPGEKGDGLGGGLWPTGASGDTPATDNHNPHVSSPFGDVNSTHSVMTATLSGDLLHVEGCLTDTDLTNPEGDVYWRTSTDVSLTSGYGEVDVWLGQCSSTGTPDYDDVAIYMGIQADGTDAATYDQDLDGVPNSLELGNTTLCGQRDPFNRYDYYDVSIPKDGVIDLSNDILGVILQYTPGGYTGTGGGKINFDRPGVMTGGAGHWNRGEPDHVIDLSNDILGVILQYNPGGLGSC